ncbi:bifunctional phosphopantothenoylcysteine decarboxylase/phosphopantothenate--cysteine ligase CoaBC, partial [Desulfonatronospira sp.]|uniref:bifunctional phosphopantothenoylcysteine decarboxylase/phosphopantothenate--cysteine ligase CoaBC n=1 Tax=Desulfonatronospira sp. TaxID=1962951 RepID=UPI0025C377E2
MLPQPYMIFDQFVSSRIHIGLTGSIAVFKSLDLIRLLQKSSIGISATLTRSCKEFVGPLTFSALGIEPLYSQDRYDPVEQPYAHLSVHGHTDLFLVAPATAGILARAAAGSADDLLSTQLLSYPGRILFAPAMNPHMWNNPAVRRNVQLLQSYGHSFIEPDIGEVACGEQGRGRFPDIVKLYYNTLKALAPQDYNSTRVLITAGPTHEYFDLVRFWSNPSSGRMGLALALSFWLRGAEVFFIHGPMLPLHNLDKFHLLPVTSASEMYLKCKDTWLDCHIGVFCAAVSDFTPVPCPQPKFKKQGKESLQLTMEPTIDILAAMSSNKTHKQ